MAKTASELGKYAVEVEEQPDAKRFAPLSEVVRFYKNHGVSPSRIVRAFGGDRGINEPLNDDWTPVYFHGRRFLSKSTMNKTNQAAVEKMEARTRAPRKETAKTQVAKVRSKKSTTAKKPVARRSVRKSQSVAVEPVAASSSGDTATPANAKRRKVVSTALARAKARLAAEQEEGEE